MDTLRTPSNFELSVGERLRLAVKMAALEVGSLFGYGPVHVPAPAETHVEEPEKAEILPKEEPAPDFEKLDWRDFRENQRVYYIQELPKDAYTDLPFESIQ